MGYGPLTSIVWTGNSLASGASRASTAISLLTAPIPIDLLVTAIILTGASGVVATGYVQLYAAGSIDGTNYPDGCTGTDGGVTLTVPPNSAPLGNGTFNCVASATTYKSNPMSVRAAFGQSLPPYIVIIGQNETGHALGATTCSLQYVAVYP